MPGLARNGEGPPHYRVVAEICGSTQNRTIELQVRARSYTRTAEWYESSMMLTGHGIDGGVLRAVISTRRTPAEDVVAMIFVEFISDFISLTPLPLCRFTQAKIDTALNFSSISNAHAENLTHKDGDP